MKYIFVIIVWLFTSTCCFAQTQEELLETIALAADSTKCMYCQFKQTKTMAILEEPSLSEGFVIYKSPDKIHWEYTSPNNFALVVDGEQITKINNGIEEDLDAKSTRAYIGLVNFIKSITTGKNLFDKSKFNIGIHDTGGLWKVVMQPKKNSIKRMFAVLTIYFEKTHNVVSEIEMTGTNGDRTIIQFFDVSINDSCD